MKKDLTKNPNCFVCGKKNSAGLRVDFEFDAVNRSLRGKFIPRPEHEGWEGIIHGGIIASLLDEAMVKAAAHLGIAAVSAEMTVRFKTPARPGEEISVEARLVDARNRLILAEGSVRRGAAIIAEANGKLLKL